MTLPGRARSGALTLIGAAITACYLFPIYWMYASSLKSPIELFASPPTLYPHLFYTNSYKLLVERGSLPLYVVNSFFLAGASTVLALLLAVPTAYGMSRVRSRWLDVALIIVMLSQVLPPALLVTPIYILFRQLGLTGTYTGAVLAFMTKALPFAIVVLRPIFLRVPIQVEEAARIDGCTRVSALFRVILPVARTGVLVAATLVFMLTYGEYVYSSAILTRRSMQPATVGLYALIGAEQSDWNNIMAFAALFATPVFILFIAMQRLIVSGLMAGAGK